MKITNILKSPRFLLFIIVIVVIILFSGRDGYTYRVGSGHTAPNGFWSDPNKITVSTPTSKYITNEEHTEQEDSNYPYCYPNDNTGISTCFKSELK
jgi:hypothetical protein